MCMRKYEGPVIDYENVGVVAELYRDLLKRSGVPSRDARGQAARVQREMESMPVNFRGVTVIADICRVVGLDPQEVGIVPHFNGDWCPEEWRRL